MIPPMLSEFIASASLSPCHSNIIIPPITGSAGWCRVCKKEKEKNLRKEGNPLKKGLVFLTVLFFGKLKSPYFSFLRSLEN
jgi:hypothetical protein